MQHKSERLFCLYTEWFTQPALPIFAVLLIIIIGIMIIIIILIDMIIIAILRIITLPYTTSTPFIITTAIIITGIKIIIKIMNFTTRSGAHTPSLKCSHYHGAIPLASGS